jgi:serine/threonine protein kinase/tetratricopeptide (TPR) repeat protein
MGDTNATGIDTATTDELDQRLAAGRPEFGNALDGLRARMLAAAGGLAPRAIGRYRLGRVLGSGAFGTVHEAEDPELDRRVAVKLLTVRSEKEAARVVREAQLLATLSHPNVVQVFEVGITEGDRSPYVVMELVEGPTLRKWLAEKPRSWREVIEVMLPVAQGLWAAHQADVIHRDLKPENVLMSLDGRPRLIDFGLARSIGDEGSRSDAGTLQSGANELASRSGSAASPQLTATGQVMGTPAYMAPEVFAGEHTPLSDQYALCVTLYEALYGERPFTAETPAALGKKVISREAELPGDRRGVPRRAGALVLRGLRRTPRERFGDLGELVKALEDMLRPRRRWPAVVAGLAVLGVSGLVIASLQPRSEPPVSETCTEGEAPFVRLREQVAIPAEVEAPLARFQQEWIEAEQALCVAGSGAMGWEQRRCLDRGLRDASALVSLLGESDVDVADIADEIERSRSPAECADPKHDVMVPPPAELDLEPLEQRLSHVRALTYTAKIEAGLELSGPLVEDVRAAGYAPLLAEALFMRGRLLLLGSDYEGARAMYEEAFFLAQESGPRWLAGWAASELLRLTVTHLDDIEGARRWSEHAETTLRRAGFEPLEHHVYVDALAGLYEREGKVEQAISLLRRAIAAEEARGKFNGGLANRLGLMHHGRKEYYEAIAALRKAASKFAELHGPHAPSVATAVDAIGVCLNQVGHHRAAYEHHLVAMRIRETTLAADHVELGMSYGNMGEVLRELGRCDESLEYLERSRALFAARLGDEHPILGTAYSMLGSAHEQCSRDGHAKAKHAYEQALRRFEAAGPMYVEQADEARKMLAALDPPRTPP